MEMFIPGSEVFNGRPLPPGELRSRISPKLALHTVDQDMVDGLDSLTYEVVRHRIWAITEEMGDTIKRMSGSHAVTESNDFDFSICDELGDQVQVGLYNSGLIGSMDLAIYWTLEHRSDNPGIEEGDMFLCNDPWVGGGLHQNDAAVLAPVFYEGKLFCWSSAICHELDLGGMAAGSWTPRATDVFAESVPTPPIKVVRGGELQRDVADAWVRRSRLPLLVGLDLRAKVGANKTAAARITALVAKYGADTVKAVMKRMMDDAERRLRTKLRKLPDGTWSAVGYQEQAGEGDRGLYPIKLKLTKDDDRLIFDFTGTSKQAGMINCPYPGLRAGIAFTVLPLLAHDIPWSAGGLFRCIEIITEEGTINNARFPAAVGKGPVGPAWATGNVVAECLGRMLDIRPETRRDVQSVCAGTFDACILAGLDERSGYPLPFVTVIFETIAMGFGAQVEQDGQDTGGVQLIPQGRCPDAEMTEFLYPLMLLWRREEIDTGGPGRTRGGLSASACAVAHKTAVPISLVFSGGGKAASQNVGLAGGYPGNTEVDLIVRSSRAAELLGQGRIPASVDDLGGEPDVMPSEGESVLMPGDALYLSPQAGGGYGDPLERDARAVAGDVVAERVSVEAASDIYGVVLAEGGASVDEAATESRRAGLRAERLARGTLLHDAAIPSMGDDRLAELQLDRNLAVMSRDGDRFVACTHCGHVLAPEGETYYDKLALFEGPPSAAGPHIWPDPGDHIDAEVVFRQLCCPGCGTAMLSTVVPIDHPLPAGGPDVGSSHVDEDRAGLVGGGPDPPADRASR